MSPTSDRLTAVGAKPEKVSGYAEFKKGRHPDYRWAANRLGAEGAWEKIKKKYGEEDRVTNFFTGDHSRPTERIKNINRQLKLNYSAPAPRGTGHHPSDRARQHSHVRG